MTLTCLLPPYILHQLKSHQLHKASLTGILFPSFTDQIIVAYESECRAELSKWLEVRPVWILHLLGVWLLGKLNLSRPQLPHL